MKSAQEPIAIVGIGCIFPDAPSPDALWQNVIAAHSSARDVPADRWLLNPEDAYDHEFPSPDHVASKRAALIDPATINLKGAKVPLDVLEALDSSVHLAVHAGLQAYADANMALIDPLRTSVVIGNIILPTEKSSQISREFFGAFWRETLGDKIRQHPAYDLELDLAGAAATNTDAGAGYLNRYPGGLPAGVLAAALGIQGGVYTLDAACAASLYSLKFACDELRNGKVDAVLAGGLSRPDCLYTQMGFSQLRAISPTGTCSPFDASANGLVVGEGCGIYVLKRLSDALRDNDKIYATVEGIGLSNDIAGSLFSPAQEGQLRAMRQAYDAAGWKPNDVSLIECHGTGTPVGDRTELESLKELWGDSGPAGSCVVGSVKSNIGHALTAAGSAGLIKTLKAIEHGVLPPTANLKQPAEGVGGSPFRVLNGPEDWQAGSNPRRAAISAFGFGGIDAHVLLQEWKDAGSVTPANLSAPLVKVEDSNDQVDIAIVGMAAHLGPWNTLRAFQERLLGGGTAHTPRALSNWWGIEESRWFRQRFGDGAHFMGYPIESVELPLQRFRIPPSEMREMLPQQALMLNVAAAAMDDAAIDAGLKEDPANPWWREPIKLPHERTGVFIGVGHDFNATNFSFRWNLLNDGRAWCDLIRKQDFEVDDSEQWTDAMREAFHPALSANRVMGALGGIVASRVARAFKVGGPSFTISSEETSGIRAAERAMGLLQRRELDCAVVGAVDFACDPRAVLTAHGSRPHRIGGTREGILPADGAAALILKRYDDALRDGDRVYAVLKGSGTSNATRVPSGQPSSISLTSSLNRALTDAGVAPKSVGLHIAQASGLPSEDSQEVGALAEVLGKQRPPYTACAVAGVAPLMGFAGVASSLVNVVAGALSTYQEVLPAFDATCTSHPELARDNGPLCALKESEYWLRDRADGPRHTTVSSIGADGSIAHLVMGAAESSPSGAARIEVERRQPQGSRDDALFLFSASREEALVAQLRELAALAKSKADESIESLAREWFQRSAKRASQLHRCSVIARNVEELPGLISRAVERITGEDSSIPNPGNDQRVFYTREPLGYREEHGKLAFVYPGSGNQFLGMGRSLGSSFPGVYRTQDLSNQHLRKQYASARFWRSQSMDALYKDHPALIFGHVSLGTAYTDLIRSFGVEPDAAIGYSIGETESFFSLGVWQDRDEMLDRVHQSKLFTQDIAGPNLAAKATWGLADDEEAKWELGVADCPAERANHVLSRYERLYLLIVNTPDECVIGGDPEQLKAALEELACTFHPVQGVTTVHCEVAKEVEKAYRDLHLFDVYPDEDIDFYSGYWGGKFELSTDNCADTITLQALHGFNYPKVIESAYADGVRVFLEIGPGSSCKRMISSILGDRPHLALALCPTSAQAVPALLRVLAQLHAHGYAANLHELYGHETLAEGHYAAPADKPISVSVRQGGDPFDPPLPRLVRSEPRVTTQPERAPAPAETPVPVKLAGASNALSTLRQQLQSSRSARQRVSQRFERLSGRITAIRERDTREAVDRTRILTAPVPTRERKLTTPLRSHPAPLFDREMCMEIAIGSIAKVLGPDFAPVDSHPTRVRLPDTPLMLVDRIVSIEGETRSLLRVARGETKDESGKLLGSGRLVTEHDILPDDWYLDANRIPVSIAVESGQADLFLSGYLGIDFLTKGEAVYRLLDAQVTFHDDLPGPGKVISYDIRIEHFFRQGDTWLFRFNFDGTVDGKSLITMRNGCAGFFTQGELDAGQGIVKTRLQQQPMKGKLPADYRPLNRLNQVEAYSEEQVDALRRGDLVSCFGEQFADLPLTSPSRLPDGLMRLVHRVTSVEPGAGRYGLGRIRAEYDISPDDWFLTCHFSDDMVMPGTLMYECCLHTLRILLMRMGWVGEHDDLAWQPIIGEASSLKCRGQVIETSKVVTYEVEIKELGFMPEPYALADVLMYADGKPIVEMLNMSVRLTGTDRETLESLWAGSATSAPEYDTRPALYDRASIIAFHGGNPSEAFGEPYRIFDKDQPRKLARLPREPYAFVDKIVSIENAEPFVLKAGAEIEAVYDVPPDAWYFASNQQPEMPFAVLLEVALQPCGWLSAYLGSALTSESDLKYRNLGGDAVQHQPVLAEAGSLITKVKLTNESRAGGMLIQHFSFEMRNESGPVYSGTTYFGFFSAEALANQVGIREITPYRVPAELASHALRFRVPTDAPFPDRTMCMLDEIICLTQQGGERNLGFVEGIKMVDPSEWFFDAHFYEDPVMPGSLGLEAFVQLLKHFAADRWGVDASSRFLVLSPGARNKWTYRGQVIPQDSRVTVQAHITEIQDSSRQLCANGILIVDGRVIYQMESFHITLA